MDSTRDEENEYSRIDYDYLIIDRESTNLTPKSQLRSSEGNASEEPSSAVKKREQKMFEPGETLPLVKKEEGKKQNSRKSTCSIKCGLLILFILLTSALSLLFCLHYLEVVKLPDRGLKTREVDTQKETMLNEEIRKLKNNASLQTLMRKLNEQNDEIDKLKIMLQRAILSDNMPWKHNQRKECFSRRFLGKLQDLSHEIERLRDEITEKDDRHATDIIKLKDNSTALQRTIDDLRNKMKLQAADINKLTNNASILMDTISSQKKTISEKEAVIANRDVDINQLKNKINELAPEHTSVMLLGGWHDYFTNSITIYNSMEKSWKNCESMLPSTLATHGAAILNNEIYIFGGYEDGTIQEPLKSLYKLGASNEWERMAAMNEKRSEISQSSVVFNSEIWVIGGWDGTALKSVEKFNPKTKKWTKMPELNESRTVAAATVVNGKIYVSAGWDGRKSKNSVEVYDPEKEKWEIFTPHMPYGAYSHILIGNQSHLIVIGGDLSKQEPTNQVWKIDVLDPKRKWEEMPSLKQRRYLSGAAIIADELMVFGGSINDTNRIDSVEIFDGVEWKNGANLPDKRGLFASIPLTCAQERLFLKRYCQNS